MGDMNVFLNIILLHVFFYIKQEKSIGLFFIV